MQKNRSSHNHDIQEAEIISETTDNSSSKPDVQELVAEVLQHEDETTQEENMEEVIKNIIKTMRGSNEKAPRTIPFQSKNEDNDGFTKINIPISHPLLPLIQYAQNIVYDYTQSKLTTERKQKMEEREPMPKNITIEDILGKLLGFIYNEQEPDLPLIPQEVSNIIHWLRYGYNEEKIHRKNYKISRNIAFDDACYIFVCIIGDTAKDSTLEDAFECFNSHVTKICT